MTERDALSALSPGATLWILPPLNESAWSTRIDWYLGFQLRRGLPHRRFDFSSDMRQLMEAYEETLPKIPRTDESPLMIASENLLPNHQTVMIPQKASENKEWVTTCHRVWKGLGSPATRISVQGYEDPSRRLLAIVATTGSGALAQAHLVILPLTNLPETPSKTAP